MGFDIIDTKSNNSRSNASYPAIYLNPKGSSTVNKMLFTRLSIVPGTSVGVNFFYDRDKDLFAIQILTDEKLFTPETQQKIYSRRSSCMMYTKPLLKATGKTLKPKDMLQKEFGVDKVICEIEIDEKSGLHSFKIERKYLLKDSEILARKSKKLGSTKVSKSKLKVKRKKIGSK